MNKKKFDLEDRLVDFAVRIIKLAEALPNSNTGCHLRNQILRSGTSPAAHYGEAQSAESVRDFMHKLKIGLKELRETNVWLKIILRAELITPYEKGIPILHEVDELIAIFYKSIKTAQEKN